MAAIDSGVEHADRRRAIATGSRATLEVVHPSSLFVDCGVIELGCPGLRATKFGQIIEDINGASELDSCGPRQHDNPIDERETPGADFETRGVSKLVQSFELTPVVTSEPDLPPDVFVLGREDVLGISPKCPQRCAAEYGDAVDRLLVSRLALLRLLL